MLRLPDRFPAADFASEISDPTSLKQPVLRRKGYEVIFLFGDIHRLPGLTVPSRLTRCYLKSSSDQVEVEQQMDTKAYGCIARDTVRFVCLRVHSWFESLAISGRTCRRHFVLTVVANADFGLTWQLDGSDSQG